MIKHIALFNLKDEAAGRTKEDNRRQILSNLERLRREIPVNKRVEAGQQLASQPASWAVDMAVLAEFDTIEDYNAYIEHPVHKEAAAFAASVSYHVEGITYESSV
ncbi:MAG: Dabb family protein [Pirellulales bacterium]|nr:Dabb family protein [Pirellulales bacterium]